MLHFPITCGFSFHTKTMIWGCQTLAQTGNRHQPHWRAQSKRFPFYSLSNLIKHLSKETHKPWIGNMKRTSVELLVCQGSEKFPLKFFFPCVWMKKTSFILNCAGWNLNTVHPHSTEVTWSPPGLTECIRLPILLGARCSPRRSTPVAFYPPSFSRRGLHALPSCRITTYCFWHLVLFWWNNKGLFFTRDWWVQKL